MKEKSIKFAWEFLISNSWFYNTTNLSCQNQFLNFAFFDRMWVMTILMRWWTKLLVPSILQCFWHSLGSDCKGRTQKMSYETPSDALTSKSSVSRPHFLYIFYYQLKPNQFYWEIIYRGIRNDSRISIVNHFKKVVGS